MIPLLATLLALASPVSADEPASLIEAVKSGSAAQVRARLDAGDDPLAKDQYGWTAAMWAAGHASAATLALLIDRTGKYPGEFRPVVEAAKGGKGANAALLVSRGWQADERDATGSTALMLAAGAGSTTTVKALLDAGAAPGLKDGHGQTALMRASQTGHAAVVALLAGRKGAGLNARDENGFTALMWAARGGQVKAIGALLAAGADRAVRGLDGSTAAELAVKRGGAEAAALFGAP